MMRNWIYRDTCASQSAVADTVQETLTTLISEDEVE
jgi:hypothetical protein